MSYVCNKLQKTSGICIARFVQKWLDKLQGGASKQKAEEETFEELKSAGVDITAVAAARVVSHGRSFLACCC